MSVLSVGFGDSASVDTGDITKSLRFRASGSTYMSRTFGTPTSNTTWTLSMWVKRGAIGAVAHGLLSAGDSEIYFRNATTIDSISFFKDGTNVANSTAVFRDPTAHGHFVFVSNGTTVKAHFNNTEVLSYTGTIPDLNSAVAHTIGKYAGGASDYLDGYLSRICFVDGTALTPTSFGYLNTEINEWVTLSRSAVKAVVDAGGTNSFMLDFDDATSLTTLGYDKRGTYNGSLLHLDGTNGSTTFTDQSGKTWTAGGNAQLSTAQFKFGTASLLCDGTGDYITTPQSSDFDFGTGDFTIDWWVRPVGSMGAQFGKRATSGAFGPIVIYNASIYLSSAGASWDIASGAVITAPTAGQWNHMALVRSGTSFKFYTNGVGTTVATSASTLWANSSVSYLGGEADGANGSNAYYDEFRVVKGRALWTGNFTPPTAASANAQNNDWTLTNHSLTAGVTYDWMEDRPGNSYAVLNPVQSSASAGIGSANLAASVGAVSDQSIGSTIVMTSGKYYFEYTHNTVDSGYPYVGVADPYLNYQGIGASAIRASSRAWFKSSGANKWNTANTAYGSSFATNDVLRVAYDADAGKLWFGKNGVWEVSGDPVTGANPSFSSVTAPVEPASFAYNCSGNYNFGQRPFSFSPPTGFLALCQANLTSEVVTVSGSFTGNLNADGPFVWLNGTPKTLTINGNAVTFGTHADKTAGGFKLRTASSSYNNTGSNTYTATIDSNRQNCFKYRNAQGN